MHHSSDLTHDRGAEEGEDVGGWGIVEEKPGKALTTGGDER